MKKFLFATCFFSLMGVAMQAQVTNTATPEVKAENFDKKFRFGLRASPQPSWFKSGNTGSKPSGAYFGFGFGLVMEFKLSNIVHFSTGIGGDFEGGSISYRNDDTYQVRVVMDNENEMVERKKDMADADYNLKSGNTLYVLKERTYKSTMVSIPLLLKMMTNEYNGMKYFAVFGGELAFRAGMKANDSYYSGLKAVPNGTVIVATPVSGDALKSNNVAVGNDALVIPARFGMNLGLGTEYRIAGSTSLVFSVNYFQSFTNMMKKNSDYLTKDEVGSNTFTQFNQAYFMRAVRINVGIMF